MVLTEIQKFEIISKYRNSNISMKQIARDLGVTRQSVSFWIKRYNENNNLSRKRDSGIRKQQDEHEKKL